jgi:hypothetical protein
MKSRTRAMLAFSNAEFRGELAQQARYQRHLTTCRDKGARCS